MKMWNMIGILCLAGVTLLPAAEPDLLKNGGFSLDGAVAEMKRRGILPPGNVSAPERGIFQSDTGELTLRTGEKKMTVVTPRTEAACLTAGGRETLKSFSVERISTDGCVALCSIDGEPLGGSRRMVLLYMTEEANSDMELAANRATLISLGTVPVLSRTGILELDLRRPGSWKLYALGLNGSRREEIPVTPSAAGQKITIDTGMLESGPTPFFELVANP